MSDTLCNKDKQLISLYQQGIKLKDICSELNYQSESQVHGRLRRLSKKHNFPLRYQKVKEYTLTEFEKGYLCGIIDGEGTLGFNITKGKLYPRLSIATTSLEEVQFLSQILHGVFRYCQRKKGETKPVHHITIGRLNDLAPLLQILKDNLIIKRQQAQLMHQFCKIHKDGNQYRWNSHSQEEWEIYNDFKPLNRKGV